MQVDKQTNRHSDGLTGRKTELGTSRAWDRQGWQAGREKDRQSDGQKLRWTDWQKRRGWGQAGQDRLGRG